MVSVREWLVIDYLEMSVFRIQNLFLFKNKSLRDYLVVVR
jgi:hypothetical protein